MNVPASFVDVGGYDLYRAVYKGGCGSFSKVNSLLLSNTRFRTRKLQRALLTVMQQPASTTNRKATIPTSFQTYRFPHFFDFDAEDSSHNREATV